MICKVKIIDTSELFSFRFTKSKNPKLERVNGDVFWLDSDLIDYIATFNSSTVDTYTAYIKVYDKYDTLIKTITVNSDCISNENSFSISNTQILLSDTDVESGFSLNTTTLTYVNLTSDITFDNTRYKDFECSVDGINFHSDKIPISELGLSGSKTLTIRRTKNNLGNLLFLMTFTNGNITDTVNISAYNKSKSLDDWHTPTLGSEWANFGSPYDNVKFKKDNNGTVFIKGCAEGSTTSTAIFTLPNIYIPANEKRFAQIGNGSLNEIKIDSSGNVYSISDTNEVHLNISFKTD